MLFSLRICIPAAIAILALSSMRCYGGNAADEEHKLGQALDKPRYTFLKDCQDKASNDNAAFSEKKCPDLGEWRVDVTEQAPQYFTVHLSQGASRISSDFTSVTKGAPIEWGRALEWHFQNNKPQYLIFRLSWGTEAAPFRMREYLVLSLITDKRMCVLASVDVKNNENANQKIRDVISDKFSRIRVCPSSVLAF